MLRPNRSIVFITWSYIVFFVFNKYLAIATYNIPKFRAFSVTLPAGCFPGFNFMNFYGRGTIMCELPKISPTSKMLLTVHDELVFEVPDDEIAKVSQFIKQAMENIPSNIKNTEERIKLSLKYLGK